MIPSDVSNLVSWWRAASLIGTFNDGDPVNSWPDLSGGGFTLTQATAALKPLFRLAAANGKPAVVFDGVDDEMLNTAYPDFGDNYSCFAIFFATGGGANGFIYDVATAAGDDNGFALIPGAATITARFADSLGLVQPSGTYARNGRLRFFQQICTGTQGQLLENGNLIQQLAYTAPNPNVLARIGVGAKITGAARWLAGGLAELFIYSKTVSASELAGLVAYSTGQYSGGFLRSLRHARRR